MQVVSPSVRAIMYTWGPGRYTAEGEHMPIRMESLQVSYPTDIMLLLPVVIEHTIDERSPLYGHTHDSLMVRPTRLSCRTGICSYGNCCTLLHAPSMCQRLELEHADIPCCPLQGDGMLS